MYTLEFTKVLQNPSKFHDDIKAHATLGAIYVCFTSKGDNLQISFSRNMTQGEVDACGILVRDYQPVSIVENLRTYMKSKIEPFIESLLLTIQAENIAMGISQSGRTSEVVGFFSEAHLLPGKTRKVSLKDSLDTNSLTVTIELFNHLILNPAIYADLAPYITQERLISWRDQAVRTLS
jgi:hypothetical protein